MLSGTPALILTENTLFDFQSGRTINWTDIKDFSMSGYRTTYISIKLNNIEKYISNMKNPLSRFYFRINSRLFHGTFAFNISLIKGNNDRIFETLELYLKSVNENSNK
jgi:hypothetical protein